jgi:hypothetical protein
VQTWAERESLSPAAVSPPQRIAVEVRARRSLDSCCARRGHPPHARTRTCTSARFARPDTSPAPLVRPCARGMSRSAPSTWSAAAGEYLVGYPAEYWHIGSGRVGGAQVLRLRVISGNREVTCSSEVFEAIAARPHSRLRAACPHSRLRAATHVAIHTRTRARARMHAHARAHTHKETHTNARSLRHSRARAHTQTHTYTRTWGWRAHSSTHPSADARAQMRARRPRDTRTRFLPQITPPPPLLRAHERMGVAAAAPRARTASPGHADGARRRSAATSGSGSSRAHAGRGAADGEALRVRAAWTTRAVTRARNPQL